MDDWDYVEEVDILPKLPADFFKTVQDPKWSIRKESLDALCALLAANPRLSVKANYGEIAGVLQTMLSKDANINVQAGVAKSICGLALGLRGKFSSYAPSIVPIALDKLKEKKPILQVPLTECLDAVLATLTSLEVVQDDILAALTKPNPQIKKGTAGLIARQINNLPSDKAPKGFIKAITPVLGKNTGDADAEVRDSTAQALGAIHRLIGDKGVRSMLGDIANDEAKMKKIQEYSEKSATEFNEKMAAKAPPPAAKVQSETASEGPSAAKASSSTTKAPVAATKEDPFEFLSNFDVLSKVEGSDFEEKISSKKWSERVEALQSFHELMEKNPKLEPKSSYGPMVDRLKTVLEKDANINVCAMAAKCIRGLAYGLRKKFAPHTPTVLPGILEKFKEKKPTLRDPLVDCIDHVTDAVSLESIQDELVTAMEKANPNIKIQTNLFLYRAFKKQTAASMPKKTLKALSVLLIKHTGDSDPEVRDASYAALGSAMRAIGDKPALSLLADIVEDKLKMQKIKEFCQKAAEEVGPEDMQQMIQSVHKADEPAPAKKQPPSRPLSRQPSKEQVNGEEALKVVNGEGASVPKKVEKKKEKEVPKKEATPPPESESSLLINNNEKAMRIKNERTLKVIKWNFVTPTPEHVEQLQEQLNAVAKPILAGQLFHKDFKQHIKACETLSAIGEGSPDLLISNSDLLLKWCTLRFFETNPAVLIKVLELAKQILELCRASDEPMSPEEMNAFIPYLLVKSGEAKDVMRAHVKDIVFILTELTSPPKITTLIIDALKTKNARQRSECLSYLEDLIIRTGVGPLKALGIHKAIAAQVSERDSTVRNNAINCLVACYREEGDQMWRNVGKIAEKERSFIEERIKKLGVAPGSAPPLTQPRPNGAKIAVPEVNSTPVRRPQSVERKPLSRNASPEVTMNHGRDIPRARSRYEIDDDFVDMGVRNLDSTKQLESLMNVSLAPVSSLRPVVSSSALKRSGSSTSISSIDTLDQLDRVIQNISSTSSDIAIDAIQQILYMCTDREMDQREMVDERISSIAKSFAVQINLIMKVYGLQSASGRELLKSVLLFFREVCNSAKPYMTEDALAEWLYAICSLLSFSGTIVAEEEDVDLEASRKAINVLILKMLGKVEATVFYCAVCRCLWMALQENHTELPQLFSKCGYKWQDIMTKNPQPLRLGAFMKATNEFYNNVDSSIRHGETDNFYWEEGKGCIEMCIQKALQIMGVQVVDAVRRLSHPNTQVISYVNVTLRTLQGSAPNWQPLLPGAVAPELPQPTSARAEHPSGGLRKEIHILVDNVVRDLGSAGKHLAALKKYLANHPEEQTSFDDYTSYCCLGNLVRELLDTTVNDDDSPFSQDEVSLAQLLMVEVAKRESAYGRDWRTSAALGKENDESLSSSLHMPAVLTQPKSPAREVVTRPARRSVDTHTLNAIKSKLACIEKD